MEILLDREHSPHRSNFRQYGLLFLDQRGKEGARGMPKLTIDGREIDVPEGTMVIQAAEQLGIFVPRYCYHPGLSIAGNCRICLVEVEGNPKLQVSCNLPVSEGMVVVA